MGHMSHVLSKVTEEDGVRLFIDKKDIIDDPMGSMRALVENANVGCSDYEALFPEIDSEFFFYFHMYKERLKIQGFSWGEETDEIIRKIKENTRVVQDWVDSCKGKEKVETIIFWT